MLCYAPLFTVCIGCPKGWVCCGRVWGNCVCTHPGWDSCCTQVPDPLCVAANTACAALKKPLDLILRGAIIIIDKSLVALDVVKGLLTAAQGILNGFKNSLNIAIKFLDGVKVIYRVGVNALSALANFVLTKIINITEMYFKVELSAANGGKFQCRVMGVLFGKNLNVQLSFDTRNILSIAKSLGERAVKGISKFIG